MVGRRGGFKSTDSGENWTPIGGGIQDAEIETLKDELANTRDELKHAHDATAQERVAQENLRAAHAAELAAAADKVAQAEAIVRSRDEKIAKMQASFSWKVTVPFRQLRRTFLDRPAPPPVS